MHASRFDAEDEPSHYEAVASCASCARVGGIAQAAATTTATGETTRTTWAIYGATTATTTAEAVRSITTGTASGTTTGTRAVTTGCVEGVVRVGSRPGHTTPTAACSTVVRIGLCVAAQTCTTGAGYHVAPTSPPDATWYSPTPVCAAFAA